jgi:hypothetical protein
LLLWTRYKNAKQLIVDELTADGYTVIPKSYLLSVCPANTDKNLKTKKEQINHAERSASTSLKSPGYIKLPLQIATGVEGRSSMRSRKQCMITITVFFVSILTGIPSHLLSGRVLLQAKLLQLVARTVPSTYGGFLSPPASSTYQFKI